jgi:hypothetical protein
VASLEHGGLWLRVCLLSILIKCNCSLKYEFSCKSGLIDNSEIDFTAIKLGDQSFLAQIIEKNYKKGVFFEVSDDGG